MSIVFGVIRCRALPRFSLFTTAFKTKEIAVSHFHLIKLLQHIESMILLC